MIVLSIALTALLQTSAESIPIPVRPPQPPRVYDIVGSWTVNREQRGCSMTRSINEAYLTVDLQMRGRATEWSISPGRSAWNDIDSNRNYTLEMQIDNGQLHPIGAAHGQSFTRGGGVMHFMVDSSTVMTASLDATNVTISGGGLTPNTMTISGFGEAIMVAVECVTRMEQANPVPLLRTPGDADETYPDMRSVPSVRRPPRRNDR